MATTTKTRRPKGAGSLVQRGNHWYARVRIDGKRREISLGDVTETEAKRKLLVITGDIAAGRMVRDNPGAAAVSHALQLVIDDYKDRRAASTEDVEARVRIHLAPAIGSLKLGKLTGRDIKDYVQRRRKADAANATINRELSVLRRALKLATEQDPPWIEKAPKVTMLREDNARSGFVDHEQYVKLRQLLPPHVAMALVIGYHTGLRRGAVVRLRLDQVDLKAGVIRIESGQAKNRERHAVPLFGDLRPWAEMALASNRKYLCELDGKPLGSFRKTWLTACKLAGVPDLLFHDLRRSAVRNMIQAGVPESVAMKISGHRTQSMLQRYNIIAERDVVRAGRIVEQHLSHPPTLGENLGEAKKEKSVAN